MTNENINTIHGLDKPVQGSSSLYICGTLSNGGCLNELRWRRNCGITIVILCCLGEDNTATVSVNV